MLLFYNFITFIQKYNMRILDFYIFSNLHVALATYFLVKLTLVQIGISENKTASFVFFSTLVSYNFIRFIRLKDITNYYNSWIIQNRHLLYLLNGIGVIGLFYYSTSLEFGSLLILIPFTLATIFYSFPFQKYSLRNIPYLKIFLIAFSWAGITVLLPLIQNFIIPRDIDYIVFIQRFLFVLFITIPFDIRDLDYDTSKLRTLPQQLGIKKTKIASTLLIILFVLLELIKPTDEQSLISKISIAFLSFLFVLKATKNQSKYYSTLFVESLPIAWYYFYIYF